MYLVLCVGRYTNFQIPQCFAHYIGDCYRVIIFRLTWCLYFGKGSMVDIYLSENIRRFGVVVYFMVVLKISVTLGVIWLEHIFMTLGSRNYLFLPCTYFAMNVFLEYLHSRDLLNVRYGRFVPIVVCLYDIYRSVDTTASTVNQLFLF